MNTLHYRISLHTMEPFFFGGETTLGGGNDKKSSYLAHSRHLPQQSALLGMLKNVLMRQHGTKTRKLRGEWVSKTQTERNKALIGTESFNPDALWHQDFGVIKAISPLWILHNAEHCLPMPNDNGCSVTYIEGTSSNPSGSIPFVEGYDFKALHTPSVQSVANGTVKTLNELLKPHEHIGNKSLYKKLTQSTALSGEALEKAEKDGLYKQTFRLMQRETAFVFDVELDASVTLHDDDVELGAEGSRFMMKVEPLPSPYKPVHPVSAGETCERVVLLSDTYVPENLSAHCRFGISGETSFRQRSRQKGAGNFTQQYWLYAAGSVFYHPDRKFFEYLNRENLQRIGMNHYYTTGAQA